MKPLLHLTLFIIFSFTVKAQKFNNEWIDYSKTYYKFKVGSFGYDPVQEAPVNKGVVRISQATLSSAGLGNIPAQQFQLLRDGEEIPLYISKATGILASGDYIEFWGEIANGKVDHDLYRDTSLQLSDHWNLETDSATYFLTVNPNGNNKRLIQTENDVSSVMIAPEKNFLFTVGRYYRDGINEGYGIFDIKNLYSSSYDIGEGFTNRPIHNNTQQPQTFSNLYADTVNTSMTAHFSLVGTYPSTRTVKILFNSDSLAQFPLEQFNAIKLSVTSISSNRIKNDAASFILQNLSGSQEDEYRAATIELQYPRVFNFGNASNFEFYINPSPNGRYLKIVNFNRSTAEAVLYDYTNGKRYSANTSIKDTLQFLLQPSAEMYHLVLVRGDGSTAQNINQVKERIFTDYLQASNQGNYLIISNPLIYGSGSNNYVQQYSDYRSSDSGGHFSVKIIDIHELEDQFSYGIPMHPLSIKNFLRYARQKFTNAPQYVFLIGKGVSYTAFRTNSNNTLTAQINLVPVFGSPGSDNLLSSDDYDPVPATPIGRLSAVSSSEVGAYLEKIKQYEAIQNSVSKTAEDKAWMKKVLQLAGANDPTIGPLIDSATAEYTKIISDTLFGGDVINYSKSADPGAYPQAVIDFTDQYNKGCGLLEYFGHSSSSSIDFNLDNPSNYTNTNKYPVFIVNGCLAGNIFDYDANRLSLKSTLSEKFVLEPQKGAIGYLSTSSYGDVSYLDIYTREVYNAIAVKQYGKGFGQITKEGISNAFNSIPHSDIRSRMHAEQLTFHGDPALVMNSFSLPDYIIDSTQITSSPDYLTVASDSFTVTVRIRNLGKAISDSVHLFLSRTFPDGTAVTVYDNKIKAIKSIDSISIRLPIVINRDKGTTIITATIDSVHLIPELSEANNTASSRIKIAAGGLLPVSPYNYSIVNTDITDLTASTAYALESTTQYVMEMDTTALFNSPAKITRKIVALGGLIQFTKIPLPLNNTVYYWRVSEDSTDVHWNSFSFIHKNSGNIGFEQAHFYQHTQSSFKGLVPDSTSRAFTFAKSYNNLFVQHSVYPTSGLEDVDFSVAVNGSIISWSACVGSSMIFNIFDPLTFKPVLNTDLPYSAGAVCDSMRRYNFEYSTQSAGTRKNAMDFLDKYVADGYYVVARKIYDLGNADWAPTVWAKDTALYGHNNSLYHRLKDQGTLIDSFTYPRTFIFVFKKNDSANFQPLSVLSEGLYDRIYLSKNITVSDTTGTVTSPLFGPAESYNKVKWTGSSLNNNNITSLNVFAVDKNGNDSLCYTIDTAQHELDISALNAIKYPYVKLRMKTQDSLTVMPYQLKDWSVELTSVPEGAMAANLGNDIPDSLFFNHDTHIAFDTLKGYVVFKNISTTAFDPLKLKMILYDQNNVAYNFPLPVVKALPAGDTVHISFLVNLTDFPEGTYNFYLEVNPDNDQPEQYHFNNFIYKYITVLRHQLLPVQLLDFTAKAYNQTALLNWSVSNEINVEKYTIEHSMNGSSFNTIGNVNATNITAPTKTYSFVHSAPPSGKNYYRIKLIDKDGKSSYSIIRNVAFGNINMLVYPNPFRNELHITATGNMQTIKLQLFDVTGKQLLQQTFNTAIDLDLAKLAAGMYILQVNDGTTIQSFKVYKQ